MDGNVKAIELQGIVRNRTKIGVEDGQAEDLLNLRFVDGSWRTSGDGRKVYVMSDNTNGYHYTQLYIHTNVYRHLLGVRNGKLWWFADIESDGVTFTPKSTPEELTAVTGDIWITQTGHLLTVIDEADNFEYFVFKTGDETYNKVMVDENGKQSSRGLYPFGKVYFNLFSPGKYNEEYSDYFTKDQIIYSSDPSDVEDVYDTHYSKIESELTEKNKFTGAFLALIAIKLYDGTFLYSSCPVFLMPNQKLLDLYDDNKYLYPYDTSKLTGNQSPFIFPTRVDAENAVGNTVSIYSFIEDANRGVIIDNTDNPKLSISYDYTMGSGKIGDLKSYIAYGIDSFLPNKMDMSIGCIYPRRANTLGSTGYPFVVFYGKGSDLVVSLEEDCVKYINQDETVDSICIFITRQVNVFDTDEDGRLIFRTKKISNSITVGGDNLNGYHKIGEPVCFNIQTRKKKEIIYDLLNSPFYLLREYKKNNINELINKPIIDLSSPEYSGLLNNITQQPSLYTEATSRISYLPKYSYMYNGKLHISNYKTTQFHGYPIDMFHLHNHSLKVESGSYFKGVLENLVDNNDAYLQYEKKDYAFPILSQSDINMYKELNRVFAFVEVDINTSNGVQKVVRYIEPYITIPAQQGRADFIESLNPILTFPDYRATSMRICILAVDSSNVPVFYEKTFTLQPHPLYNMAYYIDPDLKPISIGTLNREVELPTELNTTELFPNGLKVSKTDNPMFFPVENTYQVGSGEILAMCSNSIAVGTGQTGAAPLYVFCSDGIYALFVDSSGEMTYTNARVIARDVLNNPRSVTPIDAGVAFTTDRGLMLIAGEQVQEIGQPAEGDVLQYTDNHSADFIKIAEGAFTKVADFPNALCDKTDFLTYLTGAIVNYNHNERELMISNPEKDYSYILDRNGNWSRRDYSADEYIQNYPTSYRLRDGEFYKVDEEGDNDTTLEKRKEADNKFFYLSNVIKLDSIDFKQAARFALRGYFDTKREVVHEYSDVCVSNGYFDIVLDYKTKIKPRTHYRMTFENQYALTGTDLSISYGSRATNGDIYVSKTGEHKIPDSPDYAPIELNIYTSAFDHGKDVDALIVRLFNNGNTSSICKGKITFQEMNDDFSTEQNDYIGCYIFGSYDGRKWAMLGGNEKQGKFTDIGCKIERTDVKFFRICLSGKLRGESRIDYMEISSEPSILNGKIR